MSSIKLKAIALTIVITVVLFALNSCNDENPVETNLVENEFLPSVPAPSPGWTAEELQLISDFGGITEVIPTNEFIGGLKIVVKTEVELGDRQLGCAGSIGWCKWYYKSVDISWTWDSDFELGVEVDFVNDIPIIKAKESDIDGDGNNDPIPGKTLNGLLPITDYIEIYPYGCDSLGLSEFTILPGLYIEDSLGYIYMNAIVEE